MIIDRAPFIPYFRTLADLMGLKDWTFEVKLNDYPEDTSAYASIYCIEGRKHGIIRLSEDLLTEPREAQRHYCVHELIHALYATAMHAARLSLSADAYRVWMMTFEYAVDATAVAWAPFLPLPDAAAEKSG